MKLFIFFVSTFFLLNANPIFATSASPNPNPPNIEVETDAYANHTIIHLYYLNEKNYAVLDDHSLWELNPNENEKIEEQRDFLENSYLTIMPDTGSLNYPVTFIMFNKTDVFTANLVSIPSNGLQLLEIDPTGESITLITRSENRPPQVLKISSDNYITVQRWQKGNRVVIGGVWFPEFDPQARFNCDYLFCIYNYDTQELVFFSY